MTHGHHVPSGFITMCNGEDQVLDDLIILSLSSFAKSAFAAWPHPGGETWLWRAAPSS